MKKVGKAEHNKFMAENLTHISNQKVFEAECRKIKEEMKQKDK